MKQRGISCKLSNMLVNIKLNNNHLLDCFKAPHVSSNMLEICKPNCLILSFIHGFGFLPSTCSKIAHWIWQVPCRRIYIVGSQVFYESWKHRTWIKTIFIISLDPKVLLLTSSTLQLFVPTCWTWGRSKAKVVSFFSLELHLVVYVFGPKPCFPSWLL